MIQTMTWFTKHPACSIHNFMDLSIRFLVQFYARWSNDIITTELYNLRQEPNESIRDYLLRFDKFSISLEDEEPAACVAALKNGLRAGPLICKLTRRIPRNMQELRDRT